MKAAEELPGLTASDFARALDRACESFEASGLEREDLICELEMKISELRGEDLNLIEHSPLP